MSYVFLMPKNSIRGLEMSFPVNFRLISGELFVENFLLNFDSAKRFVFEFQQESLSLFFSYRAHFHRYEHFRGFWQSTASSSRSC